MLPHTLGHGGHIHRSPILNRAVGLKGQYVSVAMPMHSTQQGKMERRLRCGKWNRTARDKACRKFKEALKFIKEAFEFKTMCRFSRVSVALLFVGFDATWNDSTRHLFTVVTGIGSGAVPGLDGERQCSSNRKDSGSFVFSLQHREFCMIFFKSSGVKIGYLDHSDVPKRWKNNEEHWIVSSGMALGGIKQLSSYPFLDARTGMLCALSQAGRFEVVDEVFNSTHFARVKVYRFSEESWTVWFCFEYISFKEANNSLAARIAGTDHKDLGAKLLNPKEVSLRGFRCGCLRVQVLKWRSFANHVRNVHWLNLVNYLLATCLWNAQEWRGYPIRCVKVGDGSKNLHIVLVHGLSFRDAVSSVTIEGTFIFANPFYLIFWKLWSSSNVLTSIFRIFQKTLRRYKTYLSDPTCSAE